MQRTWFSLIMFWINTLMFSTGARKQISLLPGVDLERLRNTDATDRNVRLWSARILW